MSKQDYYNLILQYMMNTLDQIELDINSIKDSKFFKGYDTEDYYKLMVLYIRHDCLTESFLVIKNLLSFMQNAEK